MRFFHGKWTNAVFSAVWIFVNTVIPFLLGKRWETILRDMPIAFSVVLAILGGAVLAYQVSKMLLEVKKYAIA